MVNMVIHIEYHTCIDARPIEQWKKEYIDSASILIYDTYKTNIMIYFTLKK